MKSKSFKILATITILVLTMIPFSFATEMPHPVYNRKAFADVEVGHPQYQSIMYVVENGYSTGVGSNCWGPDRKLDFCQLSTICLNIMEKHNPGISIIDDQEAADTYTNKPYYAYKNGILFYDFNTVWEQRKEYVTFGEMWSAVAMVTNFTPLPCFFDKEENTDFDFQKDVIHSVESAGFYSKVPNPAAIATRADIADFIYKCETNSYKAQVVDESVPIVFHAKTKENSFTRQFPAGKSLNVVLDFEDWTQLESRLYAFMVAYQQLPSCVLDKFIQDNWHIVLTDNIYAQYGWEFPNHKLAGICDFANKTISIQTPKRAAYEYIFVNKGCLLHEFGHYLYQKDSDFYTQEHNFRTIMQRVNSVDFENAFDHNIGPDIIDEAFADCVDAALMREDICCSRENRVKHHVPEGVAFVKSIFQKKSKST